MKPITNLAIFLFAINGLLSTNFSEAKLKNKVHKKKITKSKKQVNLVHDQNHFHSSINQVVRRNPTLTVETKLGAERLAQPEAMLHMSNSNTSNGYNLGSFGQRAELVGKLNFFIKIFIFFFIFFFNFFYFKNPIWLYIPKDLLVLLLNNLHILDTEMNKKL